MILARFPDAGVTMRAGGLAGPPLSGGGPPEETGANRSWSVRGPPAQPQPKQASATNNTTQSHRMTELCTSPRRAFEQKVPGDEREGDLNSLQGRSRVSSPLTPALSPLRGEGAASDALGGSTGRPPLDTALTCVFRTRETMFDTRQSLVAHPLPSKGRGPG